MTTIHPQPDQLHQDFEPDDYQPPYNKLNPDQFVFLSSTARHYVELINRAIDEDALHAKIDGDPLGHYFIFTIFRDTNLSPEDQDFLKGTLPMYRPRVEGESKEGLDPDAQARIETVSTGGGLSFGDARRQHELGAHASTVVNVVTPDEKKQPRQEKQVVEPEEDWNLVSPANMTEEQGENLSRFIRAAYEDDIERRTAALIVSEHLDRETAQTRAIGDVRAKYEIRRRNSQSPQTIADEAKASSLETGVFLDDTEWTEQDSYKLAEAHKKLGFYPTDAAEIRRLFMMIYPVKAGNPNDEDQTTPEAMSGLKFMNIQARGLKGQSKEVITEQLEAAADTFFKWLGNANEQIIAAGRLNAYLKDLKRADVKETAPFASIFPEDVLNNPDLDTLRAHLIMTARYLEADRLATKKTLPFKRPDQSPTVEDVVEEITETLGDTSLRGLLSTTSQFGVSAFHRYKHWEEVLEDAKGHLFVRDYITKRLDEPREEAERIISSESYVVPESENPA